MEVQSFVGHDNWSRRFPSENMGSTFSFMDKDVTVLRPILFFHAEEKTKLSRIRANFTEHAINKLVHDKFIEIHD